MWHWVLVIRVQCPLDLLSLNGCPQCQLELRKEWRCSYATVRNPCSPFSTSAPLLLEVRSLNWPSASSGNLLDKPLLGPLPRSSDSPVGWVHTQVWEPKLYSLWEANGGTSGCPLQGGGPLRLPYKERIQLCPQWANTSPETISPAALCDKRAIDPPGFPFPTCGLTQLFITFLWPWLPGWHWW